MKKFSVDLQPSEIENSFLNRKLWIILSYIALIALFTGFYFIAKSAYKYNTFPTNINDIPLYKAELSPYRSKPNDPGGEIYENQDKLIYNKLVEKQKPATKKAKKFVKTTAKSTKQKSKNIKNPFEILE